MIYNYISNQINKNQFTNGVANLYDTVETII